MIIIGDCQLLHLIYESFQNNSLELRKVGVQVATSEFMLLLGKAFLHELNHGDRERAIAFGRALLIEIEKECINGNGQGLQEMESIDSVA